MKRQEMDESVPVRTDARSFIIRGQRELLVGGEFHYFRTPHELWEDRLVKMKRCGCNQVTTYIPWNWHEPEEGKERWTGDQDLARFLELCTQHGLFIVVKPGPYICAEWDFGGHPDWLLPKHLRLRMLDDEYLGYVNRWYKRVAEVICPFMVTRGGNVIAIQVENEYDHLLWGDEQISVEDAKAYFRRLEAMMDQHGIDIPKFANDASFLRGSNIIETRTYYPSIPWFWKWELEFYDKFVEQSRNAQPGKPVMVLELQSGWFDMFGHPSFIPDRLLTEAVTQSTLALGASYLNLYMFCGGTTFPFWGCRGDIIDVLPKGTGVTTSFDFGGSPIREWGELNPARYPWMKIFNLFCQDFKSLILQSDPSTDMAVVGGGEEVTVVHDHQAKLDATAASSSERFKVLSRRLGNSFLTLVRNMGDRDKIVDVGWSATGEKIIKHLLVRAHESYILPVEVPFPGTDITILHSTSSLLFHHAVDGVVMLGVHGKSGRMGETRLNVPVEDVAVLHGQVAVHGNGQAVLSYSHDGLALVRVRQHLLVILDQELAGKVEKLPGGILVACTYFVREIARKKNAVVLAADLLNGSFNRFYYLGKEALEGVEIDGLARPVKWEPAAGLGSFDFQCPMEHPLELFWMGDWKVREDADEAAPGYRDSAWKVLSSPSSLEDGGFLQHGHVWFRMKTQLPENAENVKISIPGNGTDLFYVYLNGLAIWSGITEKVSLDVTDKIQPGRNTIAILYENFYHTKSHPHEGVIQKYSGILGPVFVSGTAQGKSFRRRMARFRVREGLGGQLKGFADSGFDDHSWLTVPSNAKYVMSPSSAGVFWMRRKFKCHCKSGWKVAVKLRIPDAKNRLILYLNGRPLGQFEQIGPQHDFYIPEPFLQEENVLAVIWEGFQSFGDYARGWLIEPELGTFFETRDVSIKMRLKSC